jgi:hypothetical protein
VICNAHTQNENESDTKRTVCTSDGKYITLDF